MFRRCSKVFRRCSEDLSYSEVFMTCSGAVSKKSLHEVICLQMRIVTKTNMGSWIFVSVHASLRSACDAIC